MMERILNVFLHMLYREIQLECVQQLTGLSEALEGSLGKLEIL